MSSAACICRDPPLGTLTCCPGGGDRRQEAHLLPDDLQRVMVLDATHSSHPIVQKVDTPDQITAIFDAISYAKVRTDSGHMAKARREPTRNRL